MSAHIAIVDDEPRMVAVLSMLFSKNGHTPHGFATAEALLDAEPARLDLVLTDLRMPGMGGLGLLAALNDRPAPPPVILMTAHAELATALAAMRDGAFDYIEKPFDNNALLAAVERALRVGRMSRENAYLKREVGTRAAHDIIAESPAMQDVLTTVERVAPAPSTVLISGESGTGKELVARALHFMSPRVASPFVAANLGAFSAGVLESELFGHAKGAFTGAHRDRLGLFARAEGGTLFLDEVGEIDLAFQAKLLRVLQERVVTAVGADRESAVNVRLVAATNRDLKAEVAAGNFREDLYFRLAVIPIRLSPLRDRTQDILPLARHFLARHARAMGRPLGEFSPEAEAALGAHTWPGNVRELENAIERAVVLATGARVEAEDLLLEAPDRSLGASAGQTLAEHVDDATREKVRETLDAVDGRRVEAAARLGIERTTLYRLMKKHGLD